MCINTKTSGKFYTLDFCQHSLSNQFAAAYDELLGDHDPRDILVLRRIPCNLDPLANHIQSALDLQIRPNIQSLPQHAAHVVEIDDPNLERLAYEQRIELLADVIKYTNWEELINDAEAQFEDIRWPDNYERQDVIEFLQTASDQPGFGRDVGQVLLEATRQGGFTPPGESDQSRHILTVALDCLNERFHDRLEEYGLIERPSLIPRAIEALQNETTYTQATLGFEAVLALEFEEFTTNDRQYLAQLAADADLIAIGERNASIQRIKTEPGDLDSLRDDCTIDFETGSSLTLEYTAGSGPATTEPGEIASFLATGTEPSDAVSAIHLHEKTFREQISAVANEIEYRRHEADSDYNDFAVVVSSLGEQLSNARRHLRTAGLPTQTIGAPGLAEDPAVTELYAFVQFLLDRNEDAKSWLSARVDEFSPDLADACNTGSIETRLNRWIINTNLKERVATGENNIEIQEQFQNIRRVIDLAEFVDQTSWLDTSLQTFNQVLEQAIRFDAAYTHAIETAPRTEGVTVTDIKGIKHGSYNTVFLLDVVDEIYPSSERLTPLFPNPWLTDMPEYPAVTDVDITTVEETYETYSGDQSTNFFDSYYHHRDRRKLALGARAATNRLYFCTYDSKESGLGRAYNPSRYLCLLKQQEQITVEDLSMEADNRPIRTREKVAEYILNQPWDELESVVNAAHTGDSRELEDTEEVFGVVQSLLSDDVDPVFADAVATQFALARGEVIQND